MGFLFIAFFAVFLYVPPVLLLCRKVARNSTPRTGWAMAFLLIVLPAVLLTVGGMIDADNAAS
ncbi:hypothetical protein ACFWZ2_16020 [Streptomyces sp. NPDC059002]|uniref:hypothetical protein n=1 Tax=Streptomyces sp. NPDC059002 TaxID=3346690 RepID=UPI003694FB53